MINFDAAHRLGVSTIGSSQTVTPSRLAYLGDLVRDGLLTIPIAATFPLVEVRAAYQLLAIGHRAGKIVLHC